MNGTHKNQGFIPRLRFAIRGLAHGLRHEHSLRTHAVALLLLIAALGILRPPLLWWALALLAASVVIAAELFNTAVEHLADHLHPEQHPSIRIVKDCAAGAVLITVIGALIVGVLLLVSVLRR